MMHDARECMRHLIVQLDRVGVHILEYVALNAVQKAAADAYFQAAIFPVLTPLAVDPGRPFPHISNMSLNLAVVVRDTKGAEHFARVKVPNTLPRFLPFHYVDPGKVAVQSLIAIAVIDNHTAAVAGIP